MRAEEVDDSLLYCKSGTNTLRYIRSILDRQPDTADDLGHALCYHLLGSGRAVLPLAGV